MATYYLNASTGNDSTGAGTSVSPWATVGKALGSVTTNDTIYCQNAAATYVWDAETFNKTGLTLQGQTIAGVIFDGGGTEIDRWKFTNSCTITTCTFQNCKASGAFRPLYATGSGTGITVQFTNVYFKALESDGSSTGGGTVCDQIGMTFSFTNCLIYNQTQSAGSTTNAAFYAGATTASPTLWLTNCTWYNNIGAGSVGYFMLTNGGSSGRIVKLVNNIFYSVSTGQWLRNGGSPDYTGSNTNCIFNFTGTPTLTGTITSDPLFIDVANLNFGLRPTSPCIDTGTII